MSIKSGASEGSAVTRAWRFVRWSEISNDSFMSKFIWFICTTGDTFYIYIYIYIYIQPSRHNLLLFCTGFFFISTISIYIYIGICFIFEFCNIFVPWEIKFILNNIYIYIHIYGNRVLFVTGFRKGQREQWRGGPLPLVTRQAGHRPAEHSNGRAAAAAQPHSRAAVQLHSNAVQPPRAEQRPGPSALQVSACHIPSPRNAPPYSRPHRMVVAFPC